MLQSGTAPRRSAALLILLLASWAGLHGCATPPTRPVAVPSGGQVLELSFGQFVSTVSPVLERQGCDAGGDCHGGGIRGTFQLSPTTAKDLVFDFNQVVLQTYPTERDSSPILTRPLAIAAGGTPHPIKPFATTSDTDYVAIHTWIMAGVLK
jgi:hypothetical protein